MPGTRKATPEELDRLRQLHTAGLGRNAIMRATGWSGRFVSDHAKAIGLTFDRAKLTAVATEAKKADAKQLRAELALNLLQDAERLRQQLFARTITFSIGGKENIYTEHAIPEPTFGDKRALMSAIGTAVDKAVLIDKYDAGTGLPEALSLLERIAAGLTAKHGSGDAEFPEAVEGEQHA